jgi:hypothetical protein
MAIQPIPGLTDRQSEQARDLLDTIFNGSTAVAGGDENTRRRTLKFLVNRIKVYLDGITASEKVQLTQFLRERQDGICPVCKLPLPADPDAVEKHRLDRQRGYDDHTNLELRHRGCHRSEHASEGWS